LRATAAALLATTRPAAPPGRSASEPSPRSPCAPGELRTPWDRIAPHLTDWQWQPTQYGMGYLASGRLRVEAAG
jgi:hypothetical protein